MSTALAISAVTAVLESLLYEVYHSAGPAWSVMVTAVAPDIVQSILGSGTNPQLQVNLFLHQVTPNASWRNMDLPSLGADGSTRLKNQPLALDLHYLLTAYASLDYEAEALLGYAVQFMHENPILARSQIQASLDNLNPSAGSNTTNTTLSGLLSTSGLADQIELIKITPSIMGREEMAWLWTALKADYRLTFPFHVSVVLIQAQNPLVSALPVLRRNVAAQPNLLGTWAALTEVTPPNGQPAARLGDTVTIQGVNLTGAVNILLTNSRLEIPPAKLAPAVVSASSLQFAVPNPAPPVPPAAPTDLQAGVYLLSAQVSDGADTVATNSLPLVIAPSITVPPNSPVTPDAQGNATVTITCAPFLRPGQQASLLIGGWAAPANAFTTPTNTPSFSFSSLQATSQPVPVRLRVDGIDSPIIDMTKTPPVFTGPSVQVA